MAQAPIPFASPIPVARAKLQDFRSFLGQTVDKNEARKQRLTELKSLKSIAQAYGISKAAAESLSYDDLNAFVKRMEVERANETMQEQQALRQAQMAQAHMARQYSAANLRALQDKQEWEKEDRELEIEEFKQKWKFADFMTTRPDGPLTKEGQVYARSMEAAERMAPDMARFLQRIGGREITPEQYRQVVGNQLSAGMEELENMRHPTLSPAELGLPERFRPRAKAIVDERHLDPRLQLDAINALKAEAIAEQEVNRRNLADQIAANKEIREQTKFDQEQEQVNRPPSDPVYKEAALSAIDDAIGLAQGYTTTGTAGQMTSRIGGTPARDLQAALQTITSSIGFDRLQKMRDESPTGGALGQVSERELSQLNASLGAIDQFQSQDQLIKNLNTIRKQYKDAVDAVNAQREAYRKGIVLKTEEDALEYIRENEQAVGASATYDAKLDAAFETKRRQAAQRGIK